MSQSRRSFIKYLSAIPAGMAISSIGASALEAGTANKSNKGGAESADTVTLAVRFQGPLASIVEGDDVIIYAPKLENHAAGVGTSANETVIFGNADYQLSGLPSPTGPSRKIFPPVPCNAQEPYSEAQRLRNFTIRLKRPNVLEGVKPVDVMLSDKTTMPPDTPMRSFPTGIRFIYEGVPKDAALKLTGPGGFLFESNFSLDEKTGTRYYELKFGFQSLMPVDPCHIDATSSFLKLVQLFPGSNIQSIKFHNDPQCSSQSASARLVNPAVRSGHHSEQPHLMPAFFTGGFGNDCESPNMGTW